jgi:hypothetical protein
VHAAGRSVAFVCGDSVRRRGSLGSLLAAVSDGDLRLSICFDGMRNYADRHGNLAPNGFYA